jgi:hypothetical protein
MKKTRSAASAAAVGVAAALLFGSIGHAADSDVATVDDIEQLKQLIDQQREQIEQQERSLATQRQRLRALESYVSTSNRPRVQRALLQTGPAEPGPNAPEPRRKEYKLTAENGDGPVGEAPPERERAPVAAAIAERTGILTGAGTLIFEPFFSYSHSDVRRFSVLGVEFLDSVLIGRIEATEADRDTFIAGGTLRLGITDRLETEVRIPYVRREDDITSQIQTTVPATEDTRGISGRDLGDIGFGGHYQLNRGQGGWPFFVGNVRVKSDTGTGPFDVPRDSAGIETEAATGSGFWGVEPSLTVIYPTDPAVFYGNLGYLINLDRDVNETVGGAFIGNVDPGDALQASFGMGFSLNENASFSLGYRHSFVGNTTSEIDGVKVDSDELQIGSLQFGMAHKIDDNIKFNINLSAGLTEDAPDVGLGIRLPITIGGLY